MARSGAKDPASLTGKLVEISGKPHEVTKVQYRAPGTNQPSTTYEKLFGKQGRCLAWRESEEVCMVNTFDSSVAFVSPKKLKEFTPPPPEEGGFDLAWPQVPGAPGELTLDHAGGTVAGRLAEKGYCVIQMYNRPEDVTEAFTATTEMSEISPSFLMGMESAFLGKDCSTKLASLDADSMSADLDAVLNRINRDMTQVGLSVRAHTPTFLNFEAWGQTNPLLRFSSSSSTHKVKDDNSLDMYKTNANAMFGVEQSYTTFLETRRLCILYCIDNEGGDLLFSPREPLQSDTPDVRIPLAKNRLVIFRNDMLAFSYEPLGRSLALQAWVTTGQVAPSTLVKPGVEVVATGPIPRGKQAQIMSIDSRMAGGVWDCNQQWAMHLYGTDCGVYFPASRWDADAYYMEGEAAIYNRKSYTCHGGFGDLEALLTLDHEQFGMTEQEAVLLSPQQRLGLEVGYKILACAGYTPETLRGAPIGVYYGDGGLDWHSCDSYWYYNPVCHQGDLKSVYGSLVGSHQAVTCSRLSYMFDLGGPVLTTDSACSASLVAVHQAHATIMESGTGRRYDSHSMVDRALCMGSNLLFHPMTFVGSCAGNMLSHTGRCFTFDKSADGFMRGEACNGLYMHFTNRAELESERLACLAGTATNQDGRSATLTAPNGVSQQKCIRQSLLMAGLDPTQINVAECHGTGTALGDPIEVGALQATMRDGRTFPLLHTSSKSNMGHGEACAGSTGVIKCVLICLSCVGPPSVHLYALNPHLNIEGSPVLFDTEASDEGHNSSFCGVSSFGYGGANARGDVFGTCRRGPRSTQDCPSYSGRMQARSLKACPGRELGNLNWRERHERDLGDKSPEISIIGSWNGWSRPEPMEKVTKGSDDLYVAHIRLGGSRFELFQLLVNGDESQSIFPETQSADPTAELLGPGENKEKLAWMIDVDDDAVGLSPVYRITLIHSQRLLMWDVLPEPDKQDVRILGADFQHKYFISGSCNDWTFSPMEALDATHFTTEVPLGRSGALEFQLVRNQDWNQTLYPAMSEEGPTSEHIPLVGLDPFGEGLNWLVVGVPDGRLRVELDVDPENGVFIVRADGKEWRTSTRARQDAAKPTYWITTGQGVYRRLLPIADGPPQLFKARLSLGELDEVEFWIELNAGRSGELLSPSEGVVAKTDESLGETSWKLRGLPGQIFEITLDLNKDDSSKAVTWKSLERLK